MVNVNPKCTEHNSIGWRFGNTYSRLPDVFFTPAMPAKVGAPRLAIRFSAIRVDWILMSTRCRSSFILRVVVRNSFGVTFRGDKDVERTGLDDGVESLRI